MEFHRLIKSPFDCLLIDLDDTLYPSSLGLGLGIKHNIDEFLVAKFGWSEEKASSIRAELFRTYGSTLAGLIALGYDVHPDEYHSFVHGRLPYERIAANPHLAALLDSIPQPKILFTNSDRAHMNRSLERLGIEESCFSSVVCFETMNPHLFEHDDQERRANAANDDHQVVVLKPSIDAIKAAIRVAGVSDPRRTLFLDDSERNIAAGKALGLRTALVGKRMKTKESDYLVDNIDHLQRALPEIWGGVVPRMDEQSDSMEKKTMRSDLDAILTPTIQA